MKKRLRLGEIESLKNKPQEMFNDSDYGTDFSALEEFINKVCIENNEKYSASSTPEAAHKKGWKQHLQWLREFLHREKKSFKCANEQIVSSKKGKQTKGIRL